VDGRRGDCASRAVTVLGSPAGDLPVCRRSVAWPDGARLTQSRKCRLFGRQGTKGMTMRRIAAVAAVVGLLLGAAVATAGAASAKPLRAEQATTLDISWH
jgi:hypothetical protein